MPKAKLQSNFEMHYEIVENAMDLDTLFIHGNVASNTWFYPAAELFKSEGHKKGRMIMAEWRGCGKSSAPASEAELNPRVLAQDYIDLCSQLEIKKANMVSHSTGGIISLLAMSMRPELFVKSFLLDPVGPTGVKFSEAHLEAFTAMSKDRAFCELVMAGTIQGVDTSSSIFQKIVDDTFHCAPQIWHGVPHALQNLDVTAEMKKVTQPVLIVHGESDPVLPIEASRELAKTLPNARFFEAKGHGHSLNLENPKLFVQLVNEFFKS